MTSWTAAHMASPSFTISWSLSSLLPTESVMPSNHLTLSQWRYPITSLWISGAIQSSHSESVMPSNHLTLSQWRHPIISRWVSDAIQSSHAESVTLSNHLTLSQWCHPIISHWVSDAIQSSHAESVTPSNHPILHSPCGNVAFLMRGIRHVCLFSFSPSSLGKFYWSSQGTTGGFI